MAPGGVRRSARWKGEVQIRVRRRFDISQLFHTREDPLLCEDTQWHGTRPTRAARVRRWMGWHARVHEPERCTRLPPPNRVTSLSRRASALAVSPHERVCVFAAAVSRSASLPALDAPPPSDPRTGTTRSLFCFGLGYTSLGLAETLRRAGWRVAGTCRSAERARALRSGESIPAFVWCPDEKKVPRRRRRRRLRRRDARARFRTADGRRSLANTIPKNHSLDPVLADAACIAALERSGAGNKIKSRGSRT